jgi:hypothetical protein
MNLKTLAKAIYLQEEIEKKTQVLDAYERAKIQSSIYG